MDIHAITDDIISVFEKRRMKPDDINKALVHALSSMILAGSNDPETVHKICKRSEDMLHDALKIGIARKWPRKEGDVL